MIITNRIYGEEVIDTPVLLELLVHPAVLRLKGVHQHGLPERYWAHATFLRYEHCEGVMILLKRLGAPIEEQVAGLLHDVSHMTFSHLVDYLFEDYQDEQVHEGLFSKHIQASGLADVLCKHGLDPIQIGERKRFPLLEQAAPDLCADRVDYTLRELTPEKVNRFLPHLINHEGRIVFDNKDAASEFALIYQKLNTTYWGSFECRTRFVIGSIMLKRAMEIEIITKDDLWTEDEMVLAKIEPSKDVAIERCLSLLREKRLDHYEKDTKPTPKKFRWIDPLVLCNGKLERVTAFDTTFGQVVQDARRASEEGVFAIHPKYYL